MPVTPEKDPKKEVLPVFIFCFVIVVVGLIAALIWAPTWKGAMTVIEWLLACFVSGNLIGFLFAIPKNNQTGAIGGSASGTGTTEATNGYKPLVNNNLVEISDWLTKIIVGLGLVKLTKIPPYLQALAAAMAQGFSEKCTASPDAVAFAYGLIVCYLVIGFLFGYLIMRLYLAHEMVKVDQSIYSDFVQSLSAVGSKIDTLEAAQTMLTQGLIQKSDGQTDTDHQAKLDHLREMAKAYIAIKAADWGERVRLKDLSAGEMAAYATTNTISKDEILTLYAGESDEGLLLVLATLIMTQPEAGDLTRVLSHADQVTRKHIQYRIVTAIGKLMDKKLFTATDKDKVSSLLALYRKTADTSLLKKLDEIALLLKNY